MRLAFTKCHGSGNDFPLIDARALVLDDSAWAIVARALADRSGPVGGDGILLLIEGGDGASFGMRMFNSDGSEAETCLNGLRCVARAGFEALGLDEATVHLRTSSAEVARAMELSPGVYTVRTWARASQDIGATGPLSDLPGNFGFVGVGMPNPHLVRFVDRIDEDELVAIGAYCESAPPLLPQRANVSFVEIRGTDLFVRTYERGVGLTNACGSAMAASVHAAAASGHIPWGAEITVFNKGGLVRGAAFADGRVTILGNATFDYDAEIEIDPITGETGPQTILRHRAGETAAWAAAVAAIG
ncbi:MAG: diaminopimelate epimerase [Sphingomonadales bacterium]|nr:MAG: diaminopimelate epimerase [Sphingomonadales bacterium]